MFIRPITVKKNGKRHGYWALVESYRTRRGPRQRVVSYLGQMEESLRGGMRRQAIGQPYQRMLFDAIAPAWVEVDVIGTPKAMLRKFEAQLLSDDWDRVHEGLEVKRCPSPEGQETFILCRSEERRKKEQAIHERFEKRIEEGLKKIEAGCSNRKCDPIIIAQRVGRLLGHNSRAAGLFETDILRASDGRTQLVWRKVESWRNWAALSEGCYLLRTNIQDWSGEELWQAYIQLTEAEAAFRIHKSDLQIRPIWHQKTERVQAHILVCFLAYVLWKTLGQMCRAAGLGDEPRRVLEELAKIRLVDVVLPTRSGPEIRRRCVSQPTDHQAILLQRLGLNLPKNLPLSGQFLKKM